MVGVDVQGAMVGVTNIQKTVDAFSTHAYAWAQKRQKKSGGATGICDGFTAITKDVSGLVAPKGVDEGVWGQVLGQYVVKYAYLAVLGALFVLDRDSVRYEDWKSMLSTVVSNSRGKLALPEVDGLWGMVRRSTARFERACVSKTGKKHGPTVLNTFLVHVLQMDGKRLFDTLALHRAQTLILEDRVHSQDRGTLYSDVERIFPGNPTVATLYFKRMKKYDDRRRTVVTVVDDVEKRLSLEKPLLVVSDDGMRGFSLTLTPVVADVHLVNQHRRGKQAANNGKRIEVLLSQLNTALTTVTESSTELPFAAALRIYTRVKKSPDHETREHAVDLLRYLFEAYMPHRVVLPSALPLHLAAGREIRRRDVDLPRRRLSGIKPPRCVGKIVSETAVVGVYVVLAPKRTTAGEAPTTYTTHTTFEDLTNWLNGETPGAAVWLFGDGATLHRGELVRQLHTLCHWKQEHVRDILFRHLLRAGVSYTGAIAKIREIEPRWVSTFAEYALQTQIRSPRNHVHRHKNNMRRRVLIKFLEEKPSVDVLDIARPRGECYHWVVMKRFVKAREQLNGLLAEKTDHDPEVRKARKRYEQLKDAFLTRYMEQNSDGVTVCKSCGNIFHQKEFTNDGTFVEGSYMSKRYVGDEDSLLNGVVRKAIEENPGLLQEFNNQKEVEIISYLNRRMQGIAHLIGMKRFAQQHTMDYERVEHIVGLQLFLKSWKKDAEERKKDFAALQQRKNVLGCAASLWFPERLEDELFEDGERRHLYFTMILASLAASLVTLITPGEVLKMPPCEHIDAAHFKAHGKSVLKGLKLVVKHSTHVVLDNPLYAYLLYMLSASLLMSRAWRNKNIYASMTHKKRGRKGKDLWDVKRHREIAASLVHAIDAMMHPRANANLVHARVVEHYAHLHRKQWTVLAAETHAWNSLYQSIRNDQKLLQAEIKASRHADDPVAPPKPTYHVVKEPRRGVGVARARPKSVRKAPKDAKQNLAKQWKLLGITTQSAVSNPIHRAVVYPGIALRWLVLTPEHLAQNYAAAHGFAQHASEGVAAVLIRLRQNLVRLVGRPSKDTSDAVEAMKEHIRFMVDAPVPALPMDALRSPQTVNLVTVLEKGCLSALNESPVLLVAREWILEAANTLRKMRDPAAGKDATVTKLIELWLTM